MIDYKYDRGMVDRLEVSGDVSVVLAEISQLVGLIYLVCNKADVGAGRRFRRGVSLLADQSHPAWHPPESALQNIKAQAIVFEIKKEGRK